MVPRAVIVCDVVDNMTDIVINDSDVRCKDLWLALLRFVSWGRYLKVGAKFAFCREMRQWIKGRRLLACF